MSRRSLEIETLGAFDAALERSTELAGWFVQSLDLHDRGASLRRTDPQGAVFLGCAFDPGTRDWLAAHGALLFPRLPDLPFDPYRSQLYDVAELLGAPTDDYPASLDATVYAWSRAHRREEVGATLAVALHDHAIGDALDEALADADPARVVGVMGGHDLARDDPGYADAARLGRRLARSGRVVLTGGGPGAMEAANLGAWSAGAEDRVLTEALTALAAVPSYRPSVADWVRSGLEVRSRGNASGAEPGRSYGIPTWFYGHEPPNAFATGIAKYFGNALREDSLLHRSRGGLVVLPGSAGTVQEIFQAACENFYAASSELVAPIWLVGTAYWTGRLPAWPLLQALLPADSIHLVDDLPGDDEIGG